MDDEIILSDDLGNYRAELEKIRGESAQAYLLARKGYALIVSGNTYQGMAYSELLLFVEAMTGHLKKLVTLYDAAIEYLTNAIQEKCKTEERLIRENDQIGRE